MDLSAAHLPYSSAVVTERWGIIDVEGMGLRQHLGGQYVSDSKALLHGVSPSEHCRMKRIYLISRWKQPSQ